ncbi:MAG: ferrochelatase [Gammaproteobacteria bacterium]|nr:ferrochelatase [Gammaproteobacteria bacterium]
MVLVNLGTPDAPDEDSIRRYLKQFLSDPRVVNLPRWLWLSILNLIILRVRPPKLVAKYKLVWGTKDGPIRNITNALAKRVSTLTSGVPVVTAMTYGNPSLSDALRQVSDAERIIVLPLFPQYAGATTGAVQDALEQALANSTSRYMIDFVDEYHTHPGYIDALAVSVEKSKAYRDGTPQLVFSFHGIPKSQADSGDPYPLQCRTTASLVAARLNLPKDRWTLTFQSRFGPAEWLTPYTDVTMESLPGQGIHDVLVVCPGFSVDCLETIEEIKILNRDIFLAAGGKRFTYVKALNASWDHTNVILDIINKYPK